MKLSLVVLASAFLLTGCFTEEDSRTDQPDDGLSASTIEEFRLADGTPCVIIYDIVNYKGVSCDWGRAERQEILEHLRQKERLQRQTFQPTRVTGTTYSF